MCLRYSSSVVAPTQRSSPRASIGFSRFAASTAPSAAPAPTIVCRSSMKRISSPSGDLISLAAAEDLDDAADLLIPSDHRIELAFLGELGEVAAELGERLVRPFGVRRRH